MIPVLRQFRDIDLNVGVKFWNGGTEEPVGNADFGHWNVDAKLKMTNDE